jgi:hypothetical protein
MHSFYLMLDPFLIWFYRITGYAPVDFLIGTLTLAFISLLLGEFSLWLGSRALKRHLHKISDGATRYHNLSLEALSAGDRPAYKAANKLANEAFGRAFFLQVALSAAFLWPVFLALAWMGLRFSGVKFPLIFNVSLGYIGVFILVYVPAYLIFKRARRRIFTAPASH